MQDKAQKQLISRRLFLIGAGKISLMSLLLGKISYMQLLNNVQYTTLSDKNRLSLLIINPIRGKIYDTNGHVIVSNKLKFRLVLDKNITNHYIKDLNLIFHILNYSNPEQEEIFNIVKKGNKKFPLVIVDDLAWKEVSVIEEYKHQLVSIFIDTWHCRVYNTDECMSHVIGYVAKNNDNEAISRHNNYDLFIGKTGIERYYETQLAGHVGYKHIEVNANGKYIRELSRVDSMHGIDLHINIDSKLQNKIQVCLNKQNTSVIVMDCNKGRVLSMISTPGFDANQFIKLSHEYWNNLLYNPYKPLINHSLQSTYPPGSVFKLITALAALEYGIDPNKIIKCNGSSATGNRYFRCASRIGHGQINMIDAIKSSCNTYIYEIARIIGPEPIIDMAKRFGFGTKTGIDLMMEEKGLVPSRQWKKNQFKSNWTLGDTFNLSIGQGFMLSTPLQLARFVTAIASNGKLYAPQIAKNDPIYQNVNIKQGYLDIIKTAMYKVVNMPGGTGYRSRIRNSTYRVAGKTGTSQVQSKSHIHENLSRESIIWQKRNHASFVGFAPYESPMYAVAVFIAHGGDGGSAAAPIANQIMNMLLNE